MPRLLKKDIALMGSIISEYIGAKNGEISSINNFILGISREYDEYYGTHIRKLVNDIRKAKNLLAKIRGE